MKRATVILAGGKSSRFGSPKALIRIDGEVVIARLAALAVAAGAGDIYISANTPEYFASFGYPVIRDVHTGCGPLGGIHAILMGTDVDEILVIACDMPGITAEVLDVILTSADENPDAQVIFAESPSGPHPLCAIVRRIFLLEIESSLADGNFCVNELFHKAAHIKVTFEDEEPFRNLNTPDDLTRWEVTHGDK